MHKSQDIHSFGRILIWNTMSWAENGLSKIISDFSTSNMSAHKPRHMWKPDILTYQIRSGYRFGAHFLRLQPHKALSRIVKIEDRITSPFSRLLVILVSRCRFALYHVPLAELHYLP